MADEVSGSVNNGRERLELRVGTKSLGLTTKDIIPILLIVMLGIGSFIVRQNLRQWLQSLEAQQVSMQQALHEHQAALLQEMHDNREKILQEVSGWRLVVEQQTAQIRRMLETHQANRYREPADWLPLEYPTEGIPETRRDR